MHIVKGLTDVSANDESALSAWKQAKDIPTMSMQSHLATNTCTECQCHFPTLMAEMFSDKMSVFKHYTFRLGSKNQNGFICQQGCTWNDFGAAAHLV